MAIRLHGTFDRPTGPLFDLYERYVGEPRSRKDVYGYWSFIAGYLLGLVGVSAYLIGTTPGQPDFLLREVTISISAVGLALAMFGVGLLLPVRRRGIQASVLGLLITFGSVIAFIDIYPERWTTTADASGIVITAYTIGVAVVAGVAAAVPVLTGEKGWLVSDLEEGREHPPVMVGEATRGALFTVYQIGTGEWTWRVIQQDALGENAAEPFSRPDIESAVEALRETIGEARLLEITTAAFRLYETADGEWRWTLMREDGSVVATAGAAYSERDRAIEATSLLKEQGPDAPVVDVRGGAFEFYEDDGRWSWRLLDEGRTPLATGAGTYRDRDAADTAIDGVRETFADVPVLALDSFGAELHEEDGQWWWRIVDRADEVLLTGTDPYDTRRAVESSVTDRLAEIGRATVIRADQPAYGVYEGSAGWQFRLVDDDEDVVARSHEAAPTESAAIDDADWMAATISGAEIVQYEGGSYEVYAADDAWHWRLVTADRDVIAASTEAYEDAEAAERSVESVAERAREADLIEFEHAAFQQYESSGRWRWRLIDEDGNVMADSGEDYATRDEVGDAMVTLKEHAPAAEILEIETAAFELFQDDGGDWGWRLIDEAGTMVAQGSDRHPSREAAKEAMDYLVEHSDDATLRTVSGAAFQFYTDDDDAWRWRYLHPAGSTVADGVTAHATRDQLVETVAALRELASTAEVHTVADVAIVVLERGGGWRFRVIDTDRAPVAESATAYETRAAAEAAIEDLQVDAPSATVFAIGTGIVRVVARDGAYRWELVDAERSVLAISPATYDEPEAATVAADRASNVAAEASLIDYETAAFQIYRDDETWGWRLIDEDGTPIAAGAADHASQTDAQEAIDAVRSLVDDASVLEIDDAAFELHRQPDGWSWRLVDENGDPLVSSVEPRPSRREARAAMDVVKEYAPAGWISVVD